MTTTTYHTVEELGRGQQCGIEFDVDWDVHKAEPRVMYDRDGGGYPGYPAHAEANMVRVTAAWGPGWFCVRREPSRPHSEMLAGDQLITSPDWLDSLTDYVWGLIDRDDQYSHDALAAAAEDEEESRYVAAEAKAEARREQDYR